ncbi:hypothetical protein MAR_004025 [Mya arenaria]|uniref:Endonuclease/exonuclease/phosphatase domain-containing protein n=1 Tax=Mya arenaria TaxID=6604 RepID=A0ABY7EVQ2_MYAAR|nr:hypothetical protein MAR_003998 [Mya arenaria]WAR13920.1 hypothetical protein MAR_004025 [Mya arenaria]
MSPGSFQKRKYQGIHGLENLLINDNVIGLPLIVCGDLNSRTSDVADFVSHIDNVPELHDAAEILDGDTGIDRLSCDKVIVNGRFGADKGKGEFTFVNQQGSSVIDYYIVSKAITDYIVDFKVNPRIECSHCAITLSLTIPAIIANDDSPSNVTYVDINENNKAAFINILRKNVLNGCFAEFENQLADQNANIDDILLQIENTIPQTSEPFSKTKPVRKQRSGKVWFDAECRNCKSKAMQSLRIYRKHRTGELLDQYLTHKSNFKTMCKRKRLIYYRYYLNRLDSSVRNSKYFWGEIKKLSNKQRTVPQISVGEWFTHSARCFLWTEMSMSKKNL